MHKQRLGQVCPSVCVAFRRAPSRDGYVYVAAPDRGTHPGLRL